MRAVNGKFLTKFAFGAWRSSRWEETHVRFSRVFAVFLKSNGGFMLSYTECLTTTRKSLILYDVREL